MITSDLVDLFLSLQGQSIAVRSPLSNTGAKPQKTTSLHSTLEGSLLMNDLSSSLDDYDKMVNISYIVEMEGTSETYIIFTHMTYFEDILFPNFNNIILDDELEEDWTNTIVAMAADVVDYELCQYTTFHTDSISVLSATSSILCFSLGCAETPDTVQLLRLIRTGSTTDRFRSVMAETSLKFRDFNPDASVSLSPMIMIGVLVTPAWCFPDWNKIFSASKVFRGLDFLNSSASCLVIIDSWYARNFHYADTPDAPSVRIGECLWSAISRDFIERDDDESRADWAYYRIPIVRPESSINVSERMMQAILPVLQASSEGVA